MTADRLFLLANVFVLPGWLLLLVAPRWPYTQPLTAIVIPSLLATAYCSLLAGLSSGIVRRPTGHTGRRPGDISRARTIVSQPLRATGRLAALSRVRSVYRELGISRRAASRPRAPVENSRFDRYVSGGTGRAAAVSRPACLAGTATAQHQSRWPGQRFRPRQFPGQRGGLNDARCWQVA